MMAVTPRFAPWRGRPRPKGPKRKAYALAEFAQLHTMIAQINAPFQRAGGAGLLGSRMGDYRKRLVLATGGMPTPASPDWWSDGRRAQCAGSEPAQTTNR